MRTLIISDLHLGGRLRHDVLRRPKPLARLLDVLGDVDRLVLLGDVVELMQGRSQRALGVAEPVLRSIGDCLGPGGEVVLVPGNHDIPLVRSWVRAHEGDLKIDTQVPLDCTPVLARVSRWLKPAQVQVRYPGVWLQESVWATHGHYLDAHLAPESAYGVSRGWFGQLPSTQAIPATYEQRRRPSLSRASSWMPKPLATLLDEAAELTRAASMPSVRRGLLHERLAPLTAALLSVQMRHASLPALARVVNRLEVDAKWVVFGHVHRLGPLTGDDRSAWSPAGEAGPALLNCGSWLYEPLLVHRATPPHPYWPGGAVVLEENDEPRAEGLLDDLRPSELRPLG